MLHLLLLLLFLQLLESTVLTVHRLSQPARLLLHMRRPASPAMDLSGDVTWQLYVCAHVCAYACLFICVPVCVFVCECKRRTCGRCHS